MKSKSNLFELIRSLTKSEKRYFKVYAGMQKGNKNYLRLFDAIEKQYGKYDEESIRRKFADEKFVKQISFTKNYLYKLILKSLISYDSEKSTDAKIIKLISSAKVMLKKGLTDLYFKKLNEALKLASKNERFTYTVQILEMQNLYTKSGLRSGGNEMITKRIKSELNRMNNYYEYNSILSELVDLYRKRGINRSNKMVKIISAYEKLPLLKDPSHALSYRAKENFYFIHQLLADFKGERDNIYKYSVKRLNIILLHPGSFEDDSINYKHEVLKYVLQYCAWKNNKRKFEFYMKILDSLPLKSKADEVSLFFIKSFLNNVLFISGKDWQNAIERIPHIIRKIAEYPYNIEVDLHVLILYQMMFILTMAGKYEDALEQSNYLLNHPRLKMRPDLESYARLINIIIHFELKNFKYFDYLLSSNQQYLIKRKKMLNLEQAIMNFIKSSKSSAGQVEMRTRFELLKKELMEIKKDPLEKNAFKNFDFENWVDEKLKLIN